MDRSLLTLARDLRRRKARERRTLFVAEGTRGTDELLASGLAVRGVLMSATFAATPRGREVQQSLVVRNVACEVVTDREFESAADSEQPQGVLAVADVPDYSLSALALRLQRTTRLLILDAVQDPGNTGALVRTGAALGVAAIIALPGTADFWNSKAVRGAAGSLYRVPAVHASLDETRAFLTEHEVVLWGTDASGEPIDAAPAPARLALAVGNEGAGLGQAVRSVVARTVALSMSSRVESLNVAVAAGIALFALRPSPAQR